MVIKLAELDSDFENGYIHEDACRHQRDETRNRLTWLMQKAGEGGTVASDQGRF